MSSQITVRLDEEFHQQLANVAGRLRRKRSDIVRLALEKFISELDGLNGSKPYEQEKGLIGSAASGIPNLREAHSEYHIKADTLRERDLRGAGRQVTEFYKEKILEETQGLSETEMEKIIKMIHLIKNEFLVEKDKARFESFKKAKGAWKDVDIDSIYKNLNEGWKNWKPPVFA
ncbi:MAG: hypothetical protein HY787_02120 [Deltaproteobacteria bacterium]|nr:hypothetical protein [Deltaproteobacteria bacterium]